MTLLVGQYLGSYYICEHLGRGGYADVYRCVHKDLKTEHAMKVMQRPLSWERQQLFLNEVELHTLMDHPSIVKVSDSDIQNHFFLVMDYASYGTLSRLSGQQVELAIIIPYIRQLAAALDYIHQKQIVHCDVKPDNFLLNSSNTILLCDFGIAVKTTQHISGAYGTLEYVSPEQLQRKPCPASDQYSLAVTVYEWLTGEYPFDNGVDILARPAPSLRQKLPTLSQEVEDVVLQGLEKQPQNRYPSVSAFATALELAYQRTVSSSASSQPIGSMASSSPAAVLKMTRKVGATVAITFVSPSGTKPMPSVAARRQQSLYVYQMHTTEISALTWSPDGIRIASADINNTIHMWNAFDGGNASVHKGFSHMILNILWSPDNRCLAVADEVQAVQFWDIKTGKKLFRYQHRVGQPGDVGIGLYYPMAWSRNGQLMISASDDQPLEKWDTTTGNRLLTYTGHKGMLKAIAWSPDESVVASGGADTDVHIWNATSGDTQFVYSGHRGQIQALSWSPSSKRVASAGRDGLVHVWNAIDGSDLLVYNAHRPRSINSMTWSPDGTKIASVGDDRKVRIWNALNGQTLHMYEEHTDSVTLVAWSPDGEHLASASNDDTIRVWHVI
jgi:WD40 repeat protein